MSAFGWLMAISSSPLQPRDQKSESNTATASAHEANLPNFLVAISYPEAIHMCWPIMKHIVIANNKCSLLVWLVGGCTTPMKNIRQSTNQCQPCVNTRENQACLRPPTSFDTFPASKPASEIPAVHESSAIHGLGHRKWSTAPCPEFIPRTYSYRTFICSHWEVQGYATLNFEYGSITIRS